MSEICPKNYPIIAITHSSVRAGCQTYIKLKFQKAQTGVTRCEYST